MKHELENAVSLMQECGVSYDAAIRTFKRLFIVMMIERSRGNKCKAAREMGMHRNSIRRIMTELTIVPVPSCDEIARHETEGAA